jgi:hypothetical protein
VATLRVSLICLLLAGCTPQVIYLYPELPLPEMPSFPKIAGADMDCLSEEAFMSLVERDVIKTVYAERLYKVIEAHNQFGSKRKMHLDPKTPGAAK